MALLPFWCFCPNFSLKIIRFPSTNTYRCLSQVITFLYWSLPLVFRATHIIFIPHKCFLRIPMPQNQFILLHIFNFCILWYALLVIIVILLNWRWQKRRGHFFLSQLLPINFFKPRMALHLVYSMVAKPGLRFALDQSIDKINAFSWPAKWRDFVQLNLFGQYFLPDFFSVLSDIRSLK